jgi:hypothetical protein
LFGLRVTLCDYAGAGLDEEEIIASVTLHENPLARPACVCHDEDEVGDDDQDDEDDNDRNSDDKEKENDGDDYDDDDDGVNENKIHSPDL